MAQLAWSEARLHRHHVRAEVQTTEKAGGAAGLIGSGIFSDLAVHNVEVENSLKHK